MRHLNGLRRRVGDRLRNHPRTRRMLVGIENQLLRLRQRAAVRIPALARPRTYKVMISITGRCNALCLACRYERDFMVGEHLDLDTTREVLEDAAGAGFYTVRFYGGEPTLHPDLPAMIRRSQELGLRSYVTTNASTLEARIGELHAAGLRDLSIGMYGIGPSYDAYVQRPGMFARVQRGIETARRRFGSELRMQMNWLLTRERLEPRSLQEATAFARHHNLTLQIDLLHYSLPYFVPGLDQGLQFRAKDRPAIQNLVDELIQLKRDEPELLTSDLPGLRSIPAWLEKGPAMKVACNAGEMIWVGPDGTVQMCYVCFPLGNVRERRLRDLLFRDAHKRAARDALAVDCPNCHCSYNERVLRDPRAFRQYSRQMQPE